MITLTMTRERALQLGLLVCACGHPENNHFEHGPCARCDCKMLKEQGRAGTTLVEPAPERRGETVWVREDNADYPDCIQLAIRDAKEPIRQVRLELHSDECRKLQPSEFRHKFWRLCWPELQVFRSFTATSEKDACEEATEFLRSYFEDVLRQLDPIPMYLPPEGSAEEWWAKNHTSEAVAKHAGKVVVVGSSGVQFAHILPDVVQEFLSDKNESYLSSILVMDLGRFTSLKPKA